MIIILSVYHPVYKYMGKTPINIYTSPAKERYVRHVVYANKCKKYIECMSLLRQRIWSVSSKGKRKTKWDGKG